MKADLETRIGSWLGIAECRDFLDAIRTLRSVSVRLKPASMHPDELPVGPAVPWCRQGRYWNGETAPARHLAYLAGAYYIQEAGAMLAISALRELGDFSRARIVDLAAAPGGKSTQAAELNPQGLLLANEPDHRRRQALLWNHVRHRSDNTVISGLNLRALAAMLPEYFDVAILDAPCSGEGLLAKGQLGLADWSLGKIRRLAALQRQLLDCAMNLLKPGGILVYSTCTFAPEENEEQVRFLLDAGMSPIPFPDRLPASPALSPDPAVLSCCRRLWPHRDQAAGAFVALLQKPDIIPHNKPAIQEIWPRTCQLPLPSTLGPTPLYQKKGILSYLPYAPLPEALVHAAVQIGSPLCDGPRGRRPLFGYHRFIPAEFALNLSREEAELYHRGEPAGRPGGNGYWAVRWQNLPLGLIEKTDRETISLLPAPLRLSVAQGAMRSNRM